MLLPTQQAFGQVATNVMQSLLEDMEQRRKEEAERNSPKPKTDPLVEAKISASEEAKRAKEKIAQALFGQGQVDINEMRMALIEQLGEKLGIDVEEAKSSYGLGSAFEEALKSLGDSAKRQIAKDLALDELNITLDQLVASIKNPYGTDNDRLKDALERKAGNGSGLADSRRVLQRLEDIADPKSLAELKLGPQYSDPTRVEDSETRAERVQDIASAEASQKLEDVQKAQDVLEQQNDLAVALPEGAVDAVPSLDPANMLQILAAAAEQIEVVAAEDEAPDAEPTAEEQAEPVTSGEPDSEGAAQVMASKAEMIEDQQAENALQPDILAVQVDEIGLYSLLKKFVPEAA